MTISSIYDGIRDYIKDNLERYLDSCDEPTPMIKSVLRSSTVDVLGLKLYPAMMMEYGRAEGEPATTTSDYFTLPITFYFISSGGDTEKLQTLSENYVWSLKRLFEYDPTLGGVVGNMQIEGWEFSPSLPRNTSFVHMGLLYVNFEKKIMKNKEDR